MANFLLKILTPSGLYRQEEVQILNIKTQDGYVGILAGHMPFASGVEVSKLNYRDANNQVKEYAISGGFLYVGTNETTVLANTIESKEEIDLVRAQKAKEKAESRLASHDSNIDLIRAEIALKRALNRIDVKGLN